METRKFGTHVVIMDFTGINRTAIPPGTALGVVLEGPAPAERVNRTDITAETGV